VSERVMHIGSGDRVKLTLEPCLVIRFIFSREAA
jgi:hypothetical protein